MKTSLFIADVCDSIDCGIGLCEELPSRGYHCLCPNGTEQSHACAGECGGVLHGKNNSHSRNWVFFNKMVLVTY